MPHLRLRQEASHGLVLDFDPLGQPVELIGMHPERTELAPGLTISRAVTGLWQIADIERKSGALDPERGADDLARYVDAGFDTFDMADHYGSAELIVFM